MATRNDGRHDRIVELVQVGLSYAAIGRIEGVSREAIRQIASKHYIPLPADFITLQEFALIRGYHKDTIITYLRSGELDGFKRAGKWYVYKDAKRKRSCPIYGQPVGKGNAVYCDNPECAKIGQKKSKSRSIWRSFYGKTNKPISPSITLRK